MVLMVHEITPEILRIPESKFYSCNLITFDDGLYSQFLHREFFYKLNIPLVYFISSSIICPESVKQSKNIISCRDAHEMAFNKALPRAERFKNYMKMSQIRTLQAEGCEIGTHNHNHKRYSDFEDFKNNLNTSLDYFENYGLTIKKYCAPYNHDFKLGEMFVKSRGLEYFSSNRVAIETLI